MRCSSAVTSVRSKTFAVAARKWSAGSPWGKFRDEMASATSTVRGASVSCKSAMDLATHSATSLGSVIRPFRSRTINSPTLTGDSHNSFAGSASALCTRRVRRWGSSVLHSQMCVSRSSFTGRLPSRPSCRWGQRYPLKSCRFRPSTRVTFVRASPA